jgi:hypothetical protein
MLEAVGMYDCGRRSMLEEGELCSGVGSGWGIKFGFGSLFFMNNSTDAYAHIYAHILALRTLAHARYL